MREYLYFVCFKMDLHVNKYGSALPFCQFFLSECPWTTSNNKKRTKITTKTFSHSSKASLK